MKNSNFSHYAKLFALAMFVCALAFTGCKKPTDPVDETKKVELPSTIKGSWKSSTGDIYIIKDDCFINTYSDETNACYSLKNIEIAKVEGTPNDTYYLYCKAEADQYYEDWDYTFYHADCYTAIYIEVISDSALKISCAYKTESENKSLDTVKTEYTDSNGYFSNKPEYVKQ